MKKLLAILLLMFCSSASAADFVYEGTWVTTNRKLNGTMTCEVTQTGKESWTGRFHGIWHGVDFDYTVKFTGSPDNLKGVEKNIDGAYYEWKAKMDKHTPGEFNGTFTGSRYKGYFNLKQKITKKK